jgi:hypothetical protein
MPMGAGDFRLENYIRYAHIDKGSMPDDEAGRSSWSSRLSRTSHQLAVVIRAVL